MHIWTNTLGNQHRNMTTIPVLIKILVTLLLSLISADSRPGAVYHHHSTHQVRHLSFHRKPANFFNFRQSPFFAGFELHTSLRRRGGFCAALRHDFLVWPKSFDSLRQTTDPIVENCARYKVIGLGDFSIHKDWIGHSHN